MLYKKYGGGTASVSNIEIQIRDTYPNRKCSAVLCSVVSHVEFFRQEYLSGLPLNTFKL